MLEEIKLIEPVDKKDVEESIEGIKNNPSIVDTMTSFSFKYFLETVFGYIHQECQNTQVDKRRLESIVAKAAEAINGTENSLAVTSSEESDKLKKLVRDYLNSHNKPGDDVFDFGVSRRLGINFKDEIVKFFKKAGKISKRQIIQYIFAKNGIIADRDVPIPLYSEDDFIDTLVDQRIQDNFPVYFDDAVGVLRGVIAEEKEKLGKSYSFPKQGSKYNSQYPGLSKALLLIDIKNGIAQLKQEHKDEPRFIEYLELFLSLLSQYDAEFIEAFTFFVPVSEFKEGIKSILKREMASNESFNLKKSEIIKQAIYDRLSSENNGITGKITFREMLSCVPENFKKQIYDGYGDGGQNVFAILLSKAMSQYCVSSKGRKLTPKQIEDALHNRYCQELEELSKEIEGDCPDYAEEENSEYDSGASNRY